MSTQPVSVDRSVTVYVYAAPSHSPVTPADVTHEYVQASDTSECP